MQINRHKYVRAKKGAIRCQALFRGFAKRRVLASIKVQTYVRMFRRRTNYRMLKSAILALQCATRMRIAKKQLKGLMGEQKDIGKLKENNEKLKMEMQSLKAMLAAQAKEDASSLAHAKELESKQKEIEALEKRVAELEKQLASEKALVEKLEADMRLSRQMIQDVPSTHHRASSNAAPSSPGSPRGHHRKRSSAASPAHTQAYSGEVDAVQRLSMPHLPVSSEALAEHRTQVLRLEEELRAERKLRREADGEIIKLRAAINGVQLNDSDVDELLAQKLESAPKIRYVNDSCWLGLFVVSLLLV